MGFTIWGHMMLPFVMDRECNITGFIDTFTSVIWTERYSDVGDFEIVLPWSSKIGSILKTDSWVGLPDTREVMLIETTEVSLDDKGRYTMKAKGRTLTGFLENRSTGGTSPNITHRTAGQLALDAVANIVYQSGVSNAWAIPYMSIGSAAPFPAGNISYTREDTDILSSLRELCQAYDIGFTLCRANTTDHNLIFKSYSGTDRTSAQTVNPAIIFDPKLNTLSSTSEINNVSQKYTEAEVTGADTMAITYLANSFGWDKRVVKIDASDIKGSTESSGIRLGQRGQAYLATHQKTYAFDGVVSPNALKLYNRDYFMGDIVEIRTPTGNTYRARITEYIRSQNAEGELGYPTLTVIS